MRAVSMRFAVFAALDTVCLLFGVPSGCAVFAVLNGNAALNAIDVAAGVSAARQSQRQLELWTSHKVYNIVYIVTYKKQSYDNSL